MQKPFQFGILIPTQQKVVDTGPCTGGSDGAALGVFAGRVTGTFVGEFIDVVDVVDVVGVDVVVVDVVVVDVVVVDVVVVDVVVVDVVGVDVVVVVVGAGGAFVGGSVGAATGCVPRVSEKFGGTTVVKSIPTVAWL
jgi:hypothetical protein